MHHTTWWKVPEDGEFLWKEPSVVHTTDQNRPTAKAEGRAAGPGSRVPLEKQRPQRRTCVLSLLAVALASVLVTPVPPARAETLVQPMTCALVSATPGDERLANLMALMTAELAADDQVRLVERDRIDAVLREQQLSLLFDPAGGASRVRVGELLRADLLVLLIADADAEKSVQLVICETRHGLRVLAESVQLSDDAAAQSEAIAELVGEAARQVREPARALIALPPLISLDLTYEHVERGAALAKLLETAVGEVPGVWFIELEDVRAIVNELQLSDGGAGVQRSLPLAVLGEYRHDDDGRLSLTLEVRQGEESLAAFESAPLAIDEVGRYLHEEIAPRIAALATGADERIDFASDARQLAHRAEAYVKLGLSPTKR